MSDFHPTTDFPDVVEDDDQAVASTARSRDEKIQKRRRRILIAIVAIGAIVLIAQGNSWFRVLVAATATYLLFSIGFRMIGAFARPVPEPPPPGELRRVRLTYRCPTCGSELRMNLANDQVPQAPRHCGDEMELTTALEDV